MPDDAGMAQIMSRVSKS